MFSRLPFVIATANADAVSNCSSSISCWGAWFIPIWPHAFALGCRVLGTLKPAAWPGTEIADDVESVLVWFPLVLHEWLAAADDPVDVSDIEEPDDEKGGSDLSDGDGDGGLRWNCPVIKIAKGYLYAHLSKSIFIN